jgi:hypothetical protein
MTPGLKRLSNLHNPRAARWQRGDHTLRSSWRGALDAVLCASGQPAASPLAFHMATLGQLH